MFGPEMIGPETYGLQLLCQKFRNKNVKACIFKCHLVVIWQEKKYKKKYSEHYLPNIILLGLGI